MAKSKGRIPPPGRKKDIYTNFMSKSKWKFAMQKSHLNLSGRLLYAQGARVVSHALSKSRHVMSIDLTGAALGDEGTILFAEAFKQSLILTDVNLSCNQISDVGGVALASIFIPTISPSGQRGHWNRSIKTINLACNELGDYTMLAMCDVAVCNASLKLVDLQFNRICYPGLRNFGKALGINPGCEFLLQNNAIGDEGVGRLCQAWAAAGAQRRCLPAALGLAGCGTGRAGAEALGRLLAGAESPAALVACGNGLGARGMRGLVAPALQAPPPPFVLAELNVAFCLINDAGAEDLAALIAANFASLVKVQAGHNNIGDKGGVALAHSLASNQALKHLDLSSNPFGDTTGDKFYSVLASATALEKITFRQCGFSAKCKSQLNLISNPPLIDLGTGEDRTALKEFLISVKEYMEIKKTQETPAKQPKKSNKRLKLRA